MTEAERVLAELAIIFRPTEGFTDLARVRELTAPYLPKPEPDRLTVAAQECVAITALSRSPIEAAIAIRTTIAREVAAAEPSDGAILTLIGRIARGQKMTCTDVRAALKGEGA